VWEQDESDRVRTPFEPAVLAASLAMVPIVIIEADTTSEGWRQFAEVANWIVCAVFG